MPTKVYYCYNLVSSAPGGKNRGNVHCGPFELSAYDFNAVNGTAMCWAPSSLVLPYAHAVIREAGVPIPAPEGGVTMAGRTGEVVICSYVVGDTHPGGEWMTLPVQSLSPLSCRF